MSSYKLTKRNDDPDEVVEADYYQGGIGGAWT
jgi:hypothetical protein